MTFKNAEEFREYMKKQLSFSGKEWSVPQFKDGEKVYFCVAHHNEGILFPQIEIFKKLLKGEKLTNRYGREITTCFGYGYYGGSLFNIGAKGSYIQHVIFDITILFDSEKNSYRDATYSIYHEHWIKLGEQAKKVYEKSQKVKVIYT